MVIIKGERLGQDNPWHGLPAPESNTGGKSTLRYLPPNPNAPAARPVPGRLGSSAFRPLDFERTTFANIAVEDLAVIANLLDDHRHQSLFSPKSLPLSPSTPNNRLMSGLADFFISSTFFEVMPLMLPLTMTNSAR